MKTGANHKAAVSYLKQNDSQLASVIQHIGPCQLAHQGGSFAILARSILSQQISVAAAKTIRTRLLAQLPNRKLTAKAVLEMSEDQFVAAGVSAQKRKYLLDLSSHVDSGTINFRQIARWPDERVIDTLIQVKGIGRWTAQMFLLFGLGRPDVFAPDDLAIRNAMKQLYSLDAPSHDELEKIAAAWSPFRSVASWYLWRSQDLQNSKTPSLRSISDQ